MVPISLSRIGLRAWLVGAALAAGASACSDPFALPPPTLQNRVDTLVVFGVARADIGEPSGYDIVNRQRSVVELGEPFDFVVEIDGADAHLIPRGALSLGSGPGFQEAGTSFDSLLVAPSTGYNTDSLTVASPGEVILARSRTSQTGCGFIGAIARFAKLRVLEVNEAGNTVTIEMVANLNCGYRSLELGLPTE